MAPATARMVRSAAVGAIGAGLAASAHAAAGGGPPALGTLALAAVTLAVGAHLVSGGPLGVARLAALLLGAQALLHAAFELTASASPGHAHHGGDAGAALTPAGEATMVGAHLAATVVLAVLLARGEAWLFGASRVAARLVRRLVAPVASRPIARVLRSRGPALDLVRSSPSLRPLAGAASRRGPPRRALRPS